VVYEATLRINFTYSLESGNVSGSSELDESDANGVVENGDEESSEDSAENYSDEDGDKDNSRLIQDSKIQQC
jgi:hypothetical protein